MKYRGMLVAFLLAVALTFSVMAADRDVTYENDLAKDLKSLGLFSGVSDTDFDLCRAPSRVEAIVMLIRLLGEEQTAKNGDFEMPFTDVPAWAAPYVGYAYKNGLTQGISPTEFGMGDATAGTYITFVLRALGYSDANGDFDWSKPYEFASDLGVLPSFVNVNKFWRADAVTVSYAALSVDMKYKALSLAEKLMQKNVFTSAEYLDNYSGVKITTKENEGKKKLTAEELFEKCSDSVFYVEVQSENGVPLSSGSGFFITSGGMAVTNWHVIKNADKVMVTLQNGETHEVQAVWDYNPELDYAIISIDGNGYTPLECNPFPLKTASEVYAIGSPKGMKNTITQGIISNSSRVVDQKRFIQTSAAISGGSSGGVLLNPYGEVIGITSNTYNDAQNLNFARPISVIASREIITGTSPSGINWKYMRCEFDKTEFSMLPGETVAVRFDAYYYTTDGEFPSYSIHSSDEEVAIGNAGVRNDEFYIFAKGEGTVMLRISGIRGDSPEIKVTVGEGETVIEHVGVVTSVKSLRLNKGAQKVIKTNSFTVNTDEKIAHLSARSKNSKIAKVEYLSSFPRVTGEGKEGNVVRKDLKSPSPKLIITGIKDGTTEIVISNDITGEEVTIPVTVGDCYNSSYEQLAKYVFENGEYSPSNNGALTYYSLEFGTTALNETLTLLYYPSRKEIHMQVISHFSDTMYFDIIIGEEPFKAYNKSTKNFDLDCAKFSLLIPSKGIKLEGEIPFDGFGDGKDDNVYLSSFTGQSDLRKSLMDAMPKTLVTMLYAFDVVYAEYIPEIAVSDFGFADVDYFAYGIEQ